MFDPLWSAKVSPVPGSTPIEPGTIEYQKPGCMAGQSE